MEAELKHVNAQNLECPICLNIFDDPKILSCSHTFCKGCLVLLLESQVDASNIPCPVCRGVTDVPLGSVSKMPTSIALKSLVEDVQNQHQLCTNCKSKYKSEAVTFCQDCGKYMCVTCDKVHTQWEDFSDHQVLAMSDVMAKKVSIKRRRKCQKHPKEDEEFFCTDCTKYVCFRCRVIDNHERQGHAIVEASEHEAIQRRIIEGLELKADGKVAVVTQYIEFIEGQSVELTEIKLKLEETVMTAYQDALKQLTSSKDLLREEIRRKCDEWQKDLDALTETSRQQINRINKIKELVCGGRKIPLEKEALAAHDTLCEDLKGLLGSEDPDYEKARQPNKSGQNIFFERNKDRNELNLGRFENGKWKCRDIKFSTKDSMNCMASAPGGRIAIGFQPGGIGIFTPDGHLQHVILTDAEINSFGILSDGRYVVQSPDNSLTLYAMDGTKLDVDFATVNHEEGGYGEIAIDCDDQIYTSYETLRKIQVFNPTGGKAIKEIKSNGFEIVQISAMKKLKRLVACGENYVKVVDEYGLWHQTATEVGDDLYAYSSVCHDDSIIIAWVDHEEGLVTIDRYDSELDHVAPLIIGFKIQKPEERNWYCLQEFQSGELAFGTPDRMYIFYRSNKPM